MTPAAAVRVVHWDAAEPDRLAADLVDTAAVAPDLAYDAGVRAWRGRLPRWPFSRPEPAGLAALLPRGMQAEIRTSPAHPLEEPAVYPLDVDVEVWHRLDQRWHVAGDGRLCLAQGPLAWEPEDSLSEVVLKAAGWRCELVLLEAGVVTAMSVNGIVTDPSRDCLFAWAALTDCGWPA
jgi:hypothetical protein